MLPHIERDVPEFLVQREMLAYCSQLDVKRIKSSLVLSRNLRFYEFRQKELVHHIDLRSTCLQELVGQLESYSGPVSSYLIRNNTADTSGDSTSYNMLHATDELPLSIGKYVWLGKHVYVLLRCWQKLLVLRRPEEHGASFELIAQHEQLEDYRLVKGPVQYQAYVELQFVNEKRQRTNFQNDDEDQAAPPSASNSSVAGFERLMQRVHSARAELQAQRAQTQQDFVRAQELQAFGAPGQRSPLLEEKQQLRRCGDVWIRICGGVYLVLGALLTNGTGCSRPSVLHALRPLIRLSEEDEKSSLSFVHRLYELPLLPDGQPPEDYEELAQFWACQEQHNTGLSWHVATAGEKLPPEQSVVMVVRVPLEDLLQQEHIQLFALYELRGECGKMRQLQLELASINVAALLEQQEQHVPRFTSNTLHQDFLAVIMTQPASCVLQLQFQTPQQQMQFEQLLCSKLELETITVPQEQQRSSMLDATQQFSFASGPTQQSQRIFYSRQSQLLLLHNDPDQHWHIYVRSEPELCLLLRRLQRDLLQLHCNVSLLTLHEDLCREPANAALLLESALRDELQAKMDQLQQPSAANHQMLLELEMATDLLVTVIRSNQGPTETEMETT